MIVFDSFLPNCERVRDVLKDLFFSPDLLYMPQTQYTQTGN